MIQSSQSVSQWLGKKIVKKAVTVFGGSYGKLKDVLQTGRGQVVMASTISHLALDAIAQKG